MSRKEMPYFLFEIKTEAKKLFFLASNTLSLRDSPGVTSSVIPLFTIPFACFGSYN